MLLAHPDANCVIEELDGSLRRVSVTALRPDFFTPRSTFVTRYPIDLIELIFAVKGPAYLCDEIAREEDPAYSQFSLESDLLAYFDRHQFAGKRILDFGCGSGASTMILSRIFPGAKIFGIELDPEYLSVAKARARHYGFPEQRLLLSPGGTEVPTDMGQFDCVILSAVFEHLLPGERKALLPQIWGLIADGGFLFLNQTPYRFSPVETHTTGLPLINYLPDRAAAFAARSLSRRIRRDESWEIMLRKGIRGATEWQVLRLLRKASPSYAPVLLSPRGAGICDRVELWAKSARAERSVQTRVMRRALKLVRVATGLTLAPYLTIAIRKSPMTL